MDLPVVRATERHRELVTHLATERTRLREAQVVWIGGPAATDQARLPNHMPDMIAVTNATRFGENKHTLVYLSCRAGLLGQALLREHVVALYTSSAFVDKTNTQSETPNGKLTNRHPVQEKRPPDKRPKLLAGCSRDGVYLVQYHKGLL
jgi:hypothetical protein